MELFLKYFRGVWFPKFKLNCVLFAGGTGFADTHRLPRGADCAYVEVW
jgi:hypothetical protein